MDEKGFLGQRGAASFLRITPDQVRWIILGLLLGVAAASWIVLWTWGSQAGSMMGDLTMGLGALGFLTAWGAMMVAMMFPTAAPMILMFARVQTARRQQGQAFIATWVFVAGYLVTWLATGIPVYSLAITSEQTIGQFGFTATTLARAGGILLVLAGLYQLSPLKRACLSHCRSPLHFVLTQWRDGALGALRMGIRHGVYCVGCCWLLFLILLPLGSMNITAMLLLTALIFAEKTLPFSRPVRIGAAAVLCAFGVLVVFDPRLLPVSMGM
ncbi:MAG: DUF2182 domain-containing protein [Thermomicrobium sp.]|nr:DUF2182 domain-containing protein [Thermomicrobium sp.]